MDVEQKSHDLSDIASEQEEAVKTLRKELLEEGLITVKGDSLGTQDDHTLLRFLRARKFNMKNTKAMIKHAIDWRQTVLGVGVDEIYRRTDPYDYPERPEVFKHWPIWYHKIKYFYPLPHRCVFDMKAQKGRPINVESLGDIDVAELYKVISPERFWETIIATAEGLAREVLPGSSYAAGRQIDDVFIIIDLKGFGLGKFWSMKNLIKDSFQFSQDYYPETMGMLVVINAPYSFSAIWAAVRPWLAKETQDKVHIFGSDYTPFLLEHIDAENLPSSLGGKCSCTDSGGCKFSNGGPWMEGRKERRERWLKGEIPSPGLSLADRNTKAEEAITEKRGSALAVSPVLHHHPVAVGANEL